MKTIRDSFLFLLCVSLLITSCGGGSGNNNPNGVGAPIESAYKIFGNAAEYTTNGIYGTRTVIGDLNGDGLNDAAVSDYYGNHILIYFQNASGVFDQILDIFPALPAYNNGFRDIAIGDVNNDGKMDLVASGYGYNSINLPIPVMYVFYQDPVNGTLGPLLAPQAFVSGSFFSGVKHNICIADLDSDGLNDIAGMNGIDINILYQDGNGGFKPFYTYKAGAWSTSEIHAADMDDDGRVDLTVQIDNLKLSVIRQLPDGTLSSNPDVLVVDPQSSLLMYFETFKLGDLNGDGKNDIVVVFPFDKGLMMVYTQNDSGTFDPPIYINQGSRAPSSIGISDVDQDGLNEIVGIPSGVFEAWVYQQGVNYDFSEVETYSLFLHVPGGSLSHQFLAVGDVTGDNKPDAVFTWLDVGLFVLPNTN